MPPRAATITVSETLDLLDGPFAAVAKGIEQRQYALWLGSGISRERVDDLSAIIKRILSYLRDRVDASNPGCKYLQALQSCLALAQLSTTEEMGVDVNQRADDWPSLQIILQRLVGRYASLLDVTIEDEPVDFLLWDVVDVRTTFATLSPDCEHLCLAILLIEGVIPELASANWDGLVEAAVSELDGRNATLRVCVIPSDFREPPLRARLLKFHGCAIRAAIDPNIFRPLLVARQSQITFWQNDPDWAAMRHELVRLAVTMPTLMVGLSAQDTNIQSVFAEAQATMAWHWPSDPPAHVFAEETLGVFQRNILRFVYRQSYETQAAAIEDGARLQAFGKPLLTALVLHVWCAKLQAFVAIVDAQLLTDTDRTVLANGIKVLRDLVARAATGMNSIVFVRAFIQGTSHGLTLFREGRNPTPNDHSYVALGSEPIHQIMNDPTWITSGLREMAAVLGLLGLGSQQGWWRIHNFDTTQENAGALNVERLGTGDIIRVFFAANSSVGLRLVTNGYITTDDSDVLVLYSTGPIPTSLRSPSRSPGRTGRMKARELDMNTLLSEAMDMNDLQYRFRIDAAL